MPSLLSLACFGALSAADKFKPWPPKGVHRSFLDTPDGQLHIVSAGKPELGGCLFFIPGNPRSTDEFTELFERGLGCGKMRYCFSMDWFGQGHSSDVHPADRVVEFGGHHQRTYSKYLGEHFKTLNVKECTPVGSMTGANLALILANEHPHVVRQVILYGLFYFFPDILYRNQGVIDKDHAFVPALNGSHLIEDGWLERSYQPASAGTPETIWLQHRKTVDRVAALPTQWRTMQAFHNCNGDAMLGNITELEGRDTRVMLAFPAFLFDGRAEEGVFLRATDAANKIIGMMPKATVHWFEDAHMDAMNENATVVAETFNTWLNFNSRLNGAGDMPTV